MRQRHRKRQTGRETDREIERSKQWVSKKREVMDRHMDKDVKNYRHLDRQ